MLVKSSTMKKILVATDFSVHSKIALARAIDLANGFQSQVTAVHCVPDLCRALGLEQALEVMHGHSKHDVRIHLEKAAI